MATILRRLNNLEHDLTLISNADINWVLKTVSTRWKMLILTRIAAGDDQYIKLKQAFPTATNHILTKRLKELEIEKFLTIEPENIAGKTIITYGLTTKSRAILQIIKQLQQWANHWQENPESN